MAHLHTYKAKTTWTGNRGSGTKDYKAYERAHDISIEGKPVITCSSDPAFRGDPAKHNPEELLLSAISGCHMLWYLHLCAVNGVIVEDYVDNAVGQMEETKDGSGQFTSVTLYPKVAVRDESMIELANKLHHDANQMCFIARSLNFKVDHLPEAYVFPNRRTVI